jgi:hypothetical protein
MEENPDVLQSIVGWNWIIKIIMIAYWNKKKNEKLVQESRFKTCFCSIKLHLKRKNPFEIWLDYRCQ